MKGISLPVNFLIILIIAVIVIAAIFLIIRIIWPEEDWQGLYRIACTEVATIHRCNITESDWVPPSGIHVTSPKTGNNVYLDQICYMNGKNDVESCVKGCIGCM